MGTLIITDGVFNDYKLLDDIKFEGKIYVYDVRFTPSPELRTKTDRNQIESYFKNIKDGKLEVELISFNAEEELIKEIKKIYILSVKMEKDINIEFLNYIKKLTEVKPEIVFSLRKSTYVNFLKTKSQTLQSMIKDMGLENNNDKINKRVKERMKKIKKRASRNKSSIKEKANILRDLVIDAENESPFA